MTQSPPKSLARSVHWFECQVTRSSAVSISTSVYTEINIAFSLNDTPIAGNITSLFDQYCLYAVVVNVCHSQVASPNYLGRFTSAIDYDSTSAVGTETGVQQYSSALTTEVTQGLSVQRFIKPCVLPTLYVANYGPQRMWVDSASAGTGHYGFRMFWTGNTSGSLLVDVLCTYIIGARNSF